MGKSQETSNKKEVRNRKDKKRKQKELKRAKKKVAGKNSFDDMIAYVDEFGMISSTPPDPGKKTEVNAENIELAITRNRPDASSASFMRKGIVTFFNTSKGFGFIRDLESNQRVFVHVNNLLEPVQESSVVSFEEGKGPRGISALKVKLLNE